MFFITNKIKLTYFKTCRREGKYLKWQQNCANIHTYVLHTDIQTYKQTYKHMYIKSPEQKSETE